MYVGILTGLAIGLAVGGASAFALKILSLGRRTLAGSLGLLVAGALLGAVVGGVWLRSENGYPLQHMQDMGARFDELVLKAERPVLVDFYADWCAPCRKLAPILHGLAREYVGRVDLVSVDVDKWPQWARKYEVEGLPTVILFVDGKPRQPWVGVQPAEKFRPALDAALAEGAPATRPSGRARQHERMNEIRGAVGSAPKRRSDG